LTRGSAASSARAARAIVTDPDRESRLRQERRFVADDARASSRAHRARHCVRAAVSRGDDPGPDLFRLKFLRQPDDQRCLAGPPTAMLPTTIDRNGQRGAVEHAPAIERPPRRNDRAKQPRRWQQQVGEASGARQVPVALEPFPE
jgi:hypothetical protein